MNNLSFAEMLKMQYDLWEKNKDFWSPLEPKFGRNSLLWMMSEIGEVIDIIKKCGENQIMSDENIKSVFTEELCDVLMYFNDALLHYNITGEDISNAYAKKHQRNMERNYETERRSFSDGLKA